MTLIVGHRGAGALAPENTLLSFQTAIDIGCDRTELDVHLSKDNEVIVIHDKSVDRTTDGSGLVNKMTLSDLKQLNCAKGQKIPTLEEIIDLCKDKIDLHIELKGKNTSAPINELLTKNNMIDQAIVISFNIDMIREIKKLNSKLAVGYLFKEMSPTVWHYAQSVPLQYLCPFSKIVNKKMMEQARLMNLKVHAWRVNKKRLGEKLFKLGVDSVDTDYPDKFI